MHKAAQGHLVHSVCWARMTLCHIEGIWTSHPRSRAAYRVCELFRNGIVAVLLTIVLAFPGCFLSSSARLAQHDPYAL